MQLMFIHRHSHYSDNVTVSHGRSSLRTLLHFSHGSAENYQSLYSHVVTFTKLPVILNCYFSNSHLSSSHDCTLIAYFTGGFLCTFKQRPLLCTHSISAKCSSFQVSPALLICRYYDELVFQELYIDILEG